MNTLRETQLFSSNFDQKNQKPKALTVLRCFNGTDFGLLYIVIKSIYNSNSSFFELWFTITSVINSHLKKILPFEFDLLDLAESEECKIQFSFGQSFSSETNLHSFPTNMHNPHFCKEI